MATYEEVVQAIVDSGASDEEAALLVDDAQKLYGRGKYAASPVAPTGEPSPVAPTGEASPPITDFSFERVGRGLSNIVRDIPGAITKVADLSGIRPLIRRTAEELTSANEGRGINPLRPIGETLGDAGRFGIGAYNKLMEFIPGGKGLMIPGQEGAADEVTQSMREASSWENFAEKPLQTTIDNAALASMAVGGIRGARNLGGKAAALAAESMPEALRPSAATPRRLMRNAQQPPLRKSFSERNRQRATETALKDGTLPTQEGWSKIKAEMSGLDDTVSSFFQTPGVEIKGVSLDKALSSLESLASDAALAGEPKAIEQIRQVAENYRNPTPEIAARYQKGPNGETIIPADLAHDMKRAIYKSLGDTPYDAYKNNPWEIDARKEVARGLNREVGELYPELREANARYSELINLEKAISPAIVRRLNNNFIAFPTKVLLAAASRGVRGHLISAALALTDLVSTPGNKARLAIALEKLRTAGFEKDAAMVEALTREGEKMGIPVDTKFPEKSGVVPPEGEIPSGLVHEDIKNLQTHERVAAALDRARQDRPLVPDTVEDAALTGRRFVPPEGGIPPEGLATNAVGSSPVADALRKAEEGRVSNNPVEDATLVGRRLVRPAEGGMPPEGLAANAAGSPVAAALRQAESGRVSTPVEDAALTGRRLIRTRKSAPPKSAAAPESPKAEPTPPAEPPSPAGAPSAAKDPNWTAALKEAKELKIENAESLGREELFELVDKAWAENLAKRDESMGMRGGGPTTMEIITIAEKAIKSMPMAREDSPAGNARANARAAFQTAADLAREGKAFQAHQALISARKLEQEARDVMLKTGGKPYGTSTPKPLFRRESEAPQ